MKNISFSLYRKGEKHAREGDYDSALILYNEALVIDPKNPRIWDLKIAALQALGRDNEAKETAKMAKDTLSEKPQVRSIVKSDFHRNLSQIKASEDKLKCVRCGSEDKMSSFRIIDKHKIRLHRFRLTLRERRWSQYFPVCAKCKKSFEEWGKKAALPLFILRILLTILLMIDFYVWVQCVKHDRTINCDLRIYTILGIFAIANLMINYFMKSLLALFFKNYRYKYARTRRHVLQVKPENSKKWIPYGTWKEEVIKERQSFGT